MPHHFLAVCIQSIVDDPLCRIDLMVILIAKVTDALGDCFEPWSLRLLIERIISIRAIHDLAKQDERVVGSEVVFL